MQAAPSAIDRRRLRWRARRGLLENDLLIGRFLDRYEDRLDGEELRMFFAFLELPDNELLDLLLARKEPAAPLDNEVARGLLARMRAV
jgi:antitoxin CptB